jgi:hypothetical protein
MEDLDAPKNKKSRKHKGSDDIDEDEAATRFNSKNHKLKNTLLDKLMRKDANWSHHMNTNYDKIVDRTPLDMYEPEVVASDEDDEMN